ncbi:MAG: biotin--[acetyl-CoA-carboxylase] ligase [Candidatus Hydrogenedentes bacterium]|nr:biotin--[acetyl-CoA-carboxylase] ligase [Candidatus Hydrogenedentota bacterium]
MSTPEFVLGSPYPKSLDGTRLLAKQIIWYPQTESTNLLAMACETDGTVFIADQQTQGRGRHGTKWHSPAGKGLYFSVSLNGPLRGIAFAAAIALYNALSLMIPIRLKWPNDLLCNTRKVGGILIEQRENRIALGIGVNVNHDLEDFPPSLRHKAGSLRIASGETKDLQALFYTVIMHLDAAVQRLKSGQLLAVHEEWVKACDLIGKEISRGNISGRVTAIDMEGTLFVETIAGIQRIEYGDITIPNSP